MANTHHYTLWLLLLLSALAHGIHTAKAESCLNGGYFDASAVCVCPPGFGGTDCALPQCGGNAFSNPRPLQNASASVEPGAGGGSIIARAKMGAGAPISMLGSRSFLSNIVMDTSNNSANDTCACDDGWTGLGCGVCASARSCNAAFLATGGFYPSGGSVSDGGGHNVTLTCNTGPVVVNAGLMGCKVEVRRQLITIDPFIRFILFFLN